MVARLYRKVGVRARHGLPGLVNRALLPFVVVCIDWRYNAQLIKREKKKKMLPHTVVFLSLQFPFKSVHPLPCPSNSPLVCGWEPGCVGCCPRPPITCVSDRVCLVPGTPVFLSLVSAAAGTATRGAPVLAHQCRGPSAPPVSVVTFATLSTGSPSGDLGDGDCFRYCFFSGALLGCVVPLHVVDSLNGQLFHCCGGHPSRQDIRRDSATLQHDGSVWRNGPGSPTLEQEGHPCTKVV